MPQRLLPHPVRQAPAEAEGVTQKAKGLVRNGATEASGSFWMHCTCFVCYLKWELPGSMRDTGESRGLEGAGGPQPSPKDTGRVVSAGLGADVKGQRAEVTSC